MLRPGEAQNPPRFEIREDLGGDDHAALLRARDRVLGREVILERLRPAAARDPAWVRRFLREARAIARVRSPRVLALLEAGEDEKGPFLCLEAETGRPLSACLRSQGPLPAGRVARLGTQLAEALEAVHRAGIVHRNLGLEQVFVEPDGGVKVTGFALARSTNRSGDITIGQTSTHAGRRPAWTRAPEEAAGGDPDARSDLFALGVVLVACLLGRRLRETDDLLSSEGLDVRALRRERPDLPGGLEAVLGRLLKARPEERFASAAETRAALEPLADYASPAAPPRPVQPPAARSLPRRRSALAVAALLVFAAALAWVGLRSTAPLDAEAATAGRGGQLVEPAPGLESGYRRSHALVVGIDHYADPAWPDLEFAEADARAVADLLVQEESIPRDQLVLLLGSEATRDRIRGVLLDTFTDAGRVGPNDRVLFYFAGHGQQQPRLAPGPAGGRQVGYLVPADGTRARSTHITHEDLSVACEQMPAKHVLLLLDCCFSGWAATRSGVSTAHLKAATTAPVVEVIAAGRPGMPVGDLLPAARGHSPFTWCLLEGLGGAAARAGRRAVTASELGVYLQEEVAALTDGRQLPTWARIRGVGDFVFFRPGAGEGGD